MFYIVWIEQKKHETAKYFVYFKIHNIIKNETKYKLTCAVKTLTEISFRTFLIL